MDGRVKPGHDSVYENRAADVALSERTVQRTFIRTRRHSLRITWDINEEVGCHGTPPLSEDRHWRGRRRRCACGKCARSAAGAATACEGFNAVGPRGRHSRGHHRGRGRPSETRAGTLGPSRSRASLGLAPSLAPALASAALGLASPLAPPPLGLAPSPLAPPSLVSRACRDRVSSLAGDSLTMPRRGRSQKERTSP
jgi:hypothetical protein